MTTINQKQLYGFTTLQYGSLTIYSAKVRFKSIEYQPGVPYLNVEHYNGYCYISFEVIDKVLADKLWRIIGQLGKEVAQFRLDNKYKWLEL